MDRRACGSCSSESWRCRSMWSPTPSPTAHGRFADRHRDLDAILDRNVEIVAARLDHLEQLVGPLSVDRRRLIGAYFTHEYSIEAAALGNPSIVAAPDQSGVDAGDVRIIMSLRAIGEGHISSIEFRSGVITADAGVRLDPASAYATTGDRTPHAYDKRFFTTKLGDLAMLNDVEERVLDRLEERFTMAELEAAIVALDEDGIERSISRRDDAGAALVGVVELPHVVSGIDRHLRTRAVPEWPDREPRDGRRPVRPIRRR